MFSLWSLLQIHSCSVKKEEQKQRLTGSLRIVLLKGSAALSQWSLISVSVFGEPQLSAGGGRRRIICCSHELLSVVLRDSILLVNIPKPVLGNPVDEDTWPLGKFSLPAPGVSHPSPYPSTSMQELLSDIHVTHFEESSDKVTVFISLVSREFCLQFPQGWELHMAPQLAHHLTWPCGGHRSTGQVMSPRRPYRCWNQAVPWKTATIPCEPAAHSY